MQCLKSVEKLCGHLHYDTIDLNTFELSHIEDIVKGFKWSNSINLWKLSFDDKPDPENSVDEPLLTFRATGTRKGKHKFTSQQLAAELGGDIHGVYPHWKAKMKGFDMEILIDVKEDQLWIGIALSNTKLSLRNRVELGATTLNSSIAYGLVKLAGIKDGDTVLDSMAGVGMIPIECAQEYPNTYCICSDIKEDDIAKAGVNVEAFAKGRVSVLHADATNLPIIDNSVNVVIVDLPFGHRHGSYLTNKKLYPLFFDEMTRVMTKNGTAVLLTMEKNILRRVIQANKDKGWTLDYERPCDVGGFPASIFKLTLDKVEKADE